MDALTSAAGALLERIVNYGPNGLYRATREVAYADPLRGLIRRGLVRMEEVGQWSLRVYAIEPQASQALRNRPDTWYEYEQKVAAEEQRKAGYRTCWGGLRAVPRFSE